MALIIILSSLIRSPIPILPLGLAFTSQRKQPHPKWALNPKPKPLSPKPLEIASCQRVYRDTYSSMFGICGYSNGPGPPLDTGNTGTTSMRLFNSRTSRNISAIKSPGSRLYGPHIRVPVSSTLYPKPINPIPSL